MRQQFFWLLIISGFYFEIQVWSDFFSCTASLVYLLSLYMLQGVFIALTPRKIFCVEEATCLSHNNNCALYLSLNDSRCSL
jgi:hypothetical protein